MQSSEFTDLDYRVTLGVYDFGTHGLQKTGNRRRHKLPGPSDVKPTTRYQNPESNLMRDAISSRDSLRHITETVN